MALAAWPQIAACGPVATRQPAHLPRVLIADDHALVRAGLRALLELAGTCEVVAEASDGNEAVRLAFQEQPDLVVMDMDMPRMNGLEATRQLARLTPRPRVLLLITLDFAGQANELLRAGACGVLLKESSPDELALALRQVYEQGFYVASDCSRALLAPFPASPRRRGITNDALSVRELELLRLVAVGLTNRQIAGELSISVKTVEAHKSNIITRLGLRGCADLMRYAVRKACLETDQ